MPGAGQRPNRRPRAENITVVDHTSGPEDSARAPILRPFAKRAALGECLEARATANDLQRQKALLTSLADAAGLVAGAGLDAWAALRADSPPRDLLLNVRARVDLAVTRLRGVKDSDLAAHTADELHALRPLDDPDGSERALAAATQRLSDELRRTWMGLPDVDLERFRIVVDTIYETIDRYLCEREEGLGLGLQEPQAAAGVLASAPVPLHRLKDAALLAVVDAPKAKPDEITVMGPIGERAGWVVAHGVRARYARNKVGELLQVVAAAQEAKRSMLTNTDVVDGAGVSRAKDVVPETAAILRELCAGDLRADRKIGGYPVVSLPRVVIRPAAERGKPAPL
jgi:hypothetical protein